MTLRTMTETDLPAVVDLTIATFGPFYEGYVRHLLGAELFMLQHGAWEQDYRDEVPTLLAPDAGRFVVVDEDVDGITGYAAWRLSERPTHGEITHVAVAAQARRRSVGRSLCEHAIADLRRRGVSVVGIGTGDDAFHAAARALYEDLGFTKIPIAGYLRRV